MNEQLQSLLTEAEAAEQAAWAQVNYQQGVRAALEMSLALLAESQRKPEPAKFTAEMAMTFAERWEEGV